MCTSKLQPCALAARKASIRAVQGFLGLRACRTCAACMRALCGSLLTRPPPPCPGRPQGLLGARSLVVRCPVRSVSARKARSARTKVPILLEGEGASKPDSSSLDIADTIAQVSAGHAPSIFHLKRPLGTCPELPRPARATRFTSLLPRLTLPAAPHRSVRQGNGGQIRTLRGLS